MADKKAFPKKGEKKVFHMFFDEKSFQARGQKAVEVIDNNGVETVRVRGYASTIAKDRYGDVVLPSAFTKTIEDFMKNPVVLLQHDMDDPIGKVVSIQIDDVGIYITADITEDKEGCMSAIKNGVLKGFSIGYDVLDYDYAEDKDGEMAFIIKELELMEISIVSIPANRLTLIKSFRMGAKNTTAEILEEGAEKIIDAVVENVTETAEEVLEIVKETAEEIIENEIEDVVAVEPKNEKPNIQERENSSETEKASSPQSKNLDFVSRKEFEAYKQQAEDILLALATSVKGTASTTELIRKSLSDMRFSKGASFTPQKKVEEDALGKAIKNLTGK